ncbi:uncharacterized protein LOC113985006 [Pipra filicauda]|uniref:Uncharacterized protein LOC113985006 n=1 Tax=Pipra filicauda TaxID=649802 RepID=A0A7R5KVH3_9PASS|nr:uncharacterized protein LOC113985006 [Pipra filicauda]
MENQPVLDKLTLWQGLVNNLNSHGQGPATGTSYPCMKFTVSARTQVNRGPCVTLNVLKVVDLKYCNNNGNIDQGQDQDQGPGQDGSQEVIIAGQSQIVTLHKQWRVAVIQQTTVSGSWKTIWNYNTGVIATKVPQQNACYISVMNKSEMPSFDNLARLARESRNQVSLGRVTRKLTFVTSGLVNNLNSYGANITAMCSGLTVYRAYEVHATQPVLFGHSRGIFPSHVSNTPPAAKDSRPRSLQATTTPSCRAAAEVAGLTSWALHFSCLAFPGLQVNQGPCVTLNVLKVVDLKYCNNNGNIDQGQDQDQGPGQDGSQEVIIAGQSQIVTLHKQWRVAVIQQTTVSGSWKTIWNYNTGVIATKVPQQNACYISIMNKSKMPSFGNLARLARESRNQVSLGRVTRKLTFVTSGLVNNLNSYGANIMAMCSGLTTYKAYEVHGTQVNRGPCVTLNVLKVVDLKYCNNNGNIDQGQDQDQGPGQDGSQEVIIAGQSQIVTLHKQWRVAVIQQTTVSGSWKTIWNYNTGVIATKVPQQNACYISVMNKSEMPSFDNLARLARESRNQVGLGRVTRKLTFVASGLVNNLNSYGANITAMCSGLTVYRAYEVHGTQVNRGPCVTLNVLRVVDLKYCNNNGNIDQSQQSDDNCQISVGGVFQNMTISSQTRVAVFEQRSNDLSWKTIWNYNTGVIATKVMQERTCYISVLNQKEMPSFDALLKLAAENRNQVGLGRPTRKLTFVAKGLVSNLNSYGADIMTMCSGLTTYMTYEVHGAQLNLRSCTTLDVLKVVDLNYCRGNIMV